MEVIYFLIFILLLLGISLYGFSASRKSFRRMLPGELEIWVREKLLSEPQAEKLRQRYQLRNLSRESQATLINTIFIFGAVLIACGVVAFVTANWSLISKFGRLGMVTGLMLIAHGSGFYLWKVKGNSPRLGHALVLLGSLIFAADIGLIIQIFHLRADLYNCFLLWGVGALAIGYATKSAPHMILAALAGFAWLGGWSGQEMLVPLLFLSLLLLACMPFAFKQNSRGVHFITLLLWGAAVFLFLTPEHSDADVTGKWLILVSVMLGISYWNYGDWPLLQKFQTFNHDSKIIGALVIGAISYLLSFHEVTTAVIEIEWPRLDWGRLLLLGMVIVFTLFFIVTGFIKRSNKKATTPDQLVLLLIATMLLTITSFSDPSKVVLATILANLAVVFFGSLLLWLGISELDRRYFWLGMLLLAVEIVGRFFEYETGLLLKSLVFVLAGVAVMIGGVGFEKRYQKQKV